MINMKRLSRVFAIALSTVYVGTPAKADMSLSSNAQAAGFGLTTFATGFPHSGNTTTGIGPLGVAFAADGGVLVSAYTGPLYRLPSDANHQVVSNAQIIDSQGGYGGLSTLAGNVYGVTNSFGGTIFQIDPVTGTVLQAVGVGLGHSYGMETNFANGTFLVATSTGIMEVNPYTNNPNRLVMSTFVDGITINPAGTRVYGADSVNGHVLGFNISTGQKTFDFNFGSNSEGIDGLALGSGSLQGNIFVNTNTGNLWEINLTTQLLTLIGTGGSRGDYLTIDPKDNSLLISQSDRILRLTAPTGGGFGASVPEPASTVLLSLGMAAILGYRLVLRRRSSIASA